MYSHKHKCEQCGTVWEHPDHIANLSPAKRRMCHLCPQCGTDGEVEMLWWRGWLAYGGNEKPDYIFVDAHAALSEKLITANLLAGRNNG